MDPLDPLDRLALKDHEAPVEIEVPQEGMELDFPEILEVKDLRGI